MQPHTHIVRREPETGRDTFARLLREINAPDDLSVVRSERWQDVSNAAAWIFNLFHIWLNNCFCRFGCIGIHRPLPRSAAPVMVDQRIAHDPAKPCVDFATVLWVPRSADHLHAEILEGILCLLGPAKPALEEAQELGTAFGQTLQYGVIVDGRW